MWELDYKEGWAPKNWCFWDASWESLGLQGDPTVHPKGNQSWIFIGRTDVEAETPIFWPHGAKSSLTGKDLMLGKIESGRRMGRQRMRWLDGIIDSMDMSLSKLWELLVDRRPGVLQCTGSQRVGHDWATELTDFFIQTNHCFLRPSFKPPKQSLNSVTASCKHIFYLEESWSAMVYVPP